MGQFLWIYWIFTVAAAALGLVAMLMFEAESRPLAQRARKMEQRLPIEESDSGPQRSAEYAARDGLRLG